MKIRSLVFSVVVTIFLATSAQAAWDATAKVTNIEPSYMPDVILFQIDMNAESCPAGSWMSYSGTNYPPTDNSHFDHLIFSSYQRTSVVF